MEIEEAARILGLESISDLDPFDAEDPFNGGRRLRGYVSWKPDHRYGALVVHHVGNSMAEQVVYSTPKLKYPFDREGRFTWPPVKRIELYEKLDGTNVSGYRYKGGGKTFVSFKTRLLPFVGNNRFGAMLTMWQEVLEKYPGIPRAVASFGGNAVQSYEMYGARNRHLVLYDHPLDAAFLFAVEQRDGQPRILPPRSAAGWRDHPRDVFLQHLDSAEDLTSYYNRLRGEREAMLRHTDEGVVGSEGVVWYIQTPNGDWHMFKMKPESIEAIHWAEGVVIPREVIEATAYNVLETDDLCTYDGIKRLLLEDFPDEEIEIVRLQIEKIANQVNEEREFRQKVMEKYGTCGMRFSEDRGAVMR